MPTPANLDLTPDEAILAEALIFDYEDLDGRGHFLTNAESALQLTKALLARRAIPEHRWRVFVDPDYNPGGRGRSNQQIFEWNGCVGDDILRHAHFLPYLRYFIHGAALPEPIRRAFAQEVLGMEPVTSGDLAPLAKLARKLARDHRLDIRTVRDEIFRLALDCGLSAWQADSIRTMASR